MSFHEKTALAARGQWKGIIQTLGIPGSFLKRENGPCPFCGGKDRFRFSDLDGSGTWYCNQCGSGAGMEMVMRFTGLSFPEAASRVDGILGNVKPGQSRTRPEPTSDERRAVCMAVWRETLKATPGDLLHRYLESRCLTDLDVPDNLRLHPNLRDGAGGIRPAMVARVTDADGAGATLHRTFLKPDGSDKAEMGAPRKLMPGSIPEGAAIRLGPANAALGIAEGIETALAASILFGTPVWAAVSAGILEKWDAPAGTEQVWIFGDADENFHGQKSAYALANRLKSRRPEIDVHVRLPAIGTDWNDVLIAEKRK